MPAITAKEGRTACTGASSTVSPTIRRYWFCRQGQRDGQTNQLSGLLFICCNQTEAAAAAAASAATAYVQLALAGLMPYPQLKRDRGALTISNGLEMILESQFAPRVVNLTLVAS